jgi:hypothetical protein
MRYRVEGLSKLCISNMGLLENIIPNILWDAIKGIFGAIPRAISNYKFKRFFGQQAIDSDKVFIVLDPYEHPVSRERLTAGQNRFVKNFHGRKQNAALIGEDKLLGSCSVRVTKYSVSEFALFGQKTNPVKVVLDESVINNWEGTFICFGSSDSNIKTYDIESLPENNLYSFSFGQNGTRRFNIRGDNYTIDDSGDVGVLMRLQNPYHNSHKLFICAGIGEWGTSGAAYYLFKNWRQLNKRFGSKTNFVLVIKVDFYSDESAREIREYKV